MRLGLVADAHCNWRALEVALDRLKGRVDAVLFAGDAVYEYRFSNEVVELLREHSVPCVLGNHDVGILAPQGVRARGAAGVRQDNLEFVRRLPDRFELEADGHRLLMVHGSPWDPHREYVFPGSPGLRRFGDLDYDYVVLGHTHIPMAERVAGVLVVNPGSVGESRSPGRRGVGYAILDTADGKVTFDTFPDPRPAT